MKVSLRDNSIFWKHFPWQRSDEQAEWLSSKVEKGRSLFILHLFPHAEVSVHKHKWSHDGIVMFGELKIYRKGRKKLFRSGESYHIGPSEQHGGTPGQRGCVLLEIRRSRKI